MRQFPFLNDRRRQSDLRLIHNGSKIQAAMSRKPKAAKKSLLENLSLSQKFFAFSRGDEYARSPEISDFAAGNQFSFNYTNKIPASPDGFVKRISEWDGENIFKFMIEVTNLVFDCYATGEGKKLRDFADAISSCKKPPSKPIDPERTWLMAYLYGTDMFCEGQPPRAPEKSFSEIRAAFFGKFSDSSIDDSSLRKIVKELGYECLPDKRGPKGPRTKS